MAEVVLKETAPVTVVFAEMRGPYDQMPAAMGRVYAHAARMNLIPAGMPHGVYMTDPNVVPMSEAVWEVWAPVAGEPPEIAADSDGLGVKRVPARLVASTFHKGPYDTVGITYGELMRWVAEEGYEVVGPPEELYYSDPATTQPEDYLTEIQLPVRKR